ncbi:hypothetical protein J6590_105523 [Homalodisca vitripennis]|nr:hypothetical protein J6590_105523 [Homalodisca vitripennis]
MTQSLAYILEWLKKLRTLPSLGRLPNICLLTDIFFTVSLPMSEVTHQHFTRHAQHVGMQVPRVVTSANCTNSFYVANFLYRTIPAHVRDLQVSLSLYKKLITAWLVEVGADYAELHEYVKLLTDTFYTSTVSELVFPRPCVY